MDFLRILEGWTITLAVCVEAMAAVIIGLAALEGFVRSMLLFARRSQSHETKEGIRLHLGRWLTVGLEFLIAADVLRTAVAPTWNDIGQLGAIILIRTALNYQLQKDINTSLQQQAPDG